MTFPEVTAAGITSVDTVAGSGLPAGYTNGTHYDITTTAEYSSPVTICVTYDGSAVEPVRLLHHDGSTWVDITTSSGAGVVCGSADSLSPFATATGDGTVVPETTIISGPSATTASATSTFYFTSSAPDATFECSLDAGATYGVVRVATRDRRPAGGRLRAPGSLDHGRQHH